MSTFVWNYRHITSGFRFVDRNQKNLKDTLVGRSGIIIIITDSRKTIRKRRRPIFCFNNRRTKIPTDI